MDGTGYDGLEMAQAPKNASERFYRLVWPFRADVLRVAKILIGNDSEADDLAQETLLKAFAGIGSFKEGTDVRAWLLRILRNARIDRIRSAAREAGTISLDAADMDAPGTEQPEPLDGWEQPQELMNAFSDQQIIDALQKLPEDIRLTLLLVDVQQMDHSEAADILEVPVGTIKSRTHRGRAMLRKALLPKAKELRLVR
jgi:RNA polymerase sigma-70 factor, ECF subfamily